MAPLPVAANIYREGGDSGSPIFLTDHINEEPEDRSGVHLAGILWGGPADPNISWFSTLQGIEFDFDLDFKVCNPNNNPC
jgi:hypothetical protein